MKKILMISSLLLINNASAQTCIPKPDCADMGYTDTSCEGTSLKCPFDTTKMICLSEVMKKKSSNCPVGTIYYSDGTCSSNYDSSKTAIGVVVKDNELVLSQRSSSGMYWSNANIDTSLPNYSSKDDAKTDYNGKSNTIAIVAEDSNNIAAKYCNYYTTTGTNAGDWYLPAAGELYSYVASNYGAISTTMARLGWNWNFCWHWSSSEYDGSGAWFVGSDGDGGSYSKDFERCVSCLLAIN